MLRDFTSITIIILLIGCSSKEVVSPLYKHNSIKITAVENQRDCFLNVENKTNFDTDVLSNISIALISQFFR